MTTIVREWLRIGTIGFGGPPTHVALLRRLCVDERGWITEEQFADDMAATNLLPGPASTQLAILCAWRLRGARGAIAGGICFIVPGLLVILGLAALFLSGHPARWVLGAAAGLGAAVPAVAARAAGTLVPASWSRAGPRRSARARWVGYAAAAGVAAITAGPYLVVVLVACGVLESMVFTRSRRIERPLVLATAAHAVALGGVGAVIWVAFKVGALSFGGGFVIIPLMQHDAVTTYHWMTGGQFLNAVALGQVTPGPVVQTVAVVGYAAGGLGSALLASLVAFAPSFVFVLLGAPHFNRLRANAAVGAFLAGATPAAIGAIAGSAVSLGLELQRLWQVGVLCAAVIWLLVARRGVVSGLLASGALGVILVSAGLPS
jgi:chromate transporter